MEHLDLILAGAMLLIAFGVLIAWHHSDKERRRREKWRARDRYLANARLDLFNRTHPSSRTDADA